MKIAILPGDGIGTEIVGQAQRVLDALRDEGLPITTETAPMGGAGYDAAGHPLPPATLKLDLRGSVKKPGLPSKPARERPRKGGDPVAGGSWWAARARAGEVAPGFSRDEILRPAKEDPRADGGLFVRVSGFLRELSSGGSIG